jgi:hypothetical protein
MKEEMVILNFTKKLNNFGYSNKELRKFLKKFSLIDD